MEIWRILHEVYQLSEFFNEIIDLRQLIQVSVSKSYFHYFLEDQLIQMLILANDQNQDLSVLSLHQIARENYYDVLELCLVE